MPKKVAQPPKQTKQDQKVEKNQNKLEGYIAVLKHIGNHQY